MLRKLLYGILSLLVLFYALGNHAAILSRGAGISAPRTTSYYFAAAGSDSANCSLATPCQTITKANSLSFPANAAVYFNGGDTFTGCPVFSYATNVTGSGVIVTSYGSGKATIVPNCPSSAGAVIIDGVNAFTWTDLDLAGGSAINQRGGIIVQNGSATPYTSGVTIANSDISGFSNPTFISAEIFLLGWALNGSQSSIDNIQILNNTLHGATPTSSRLWQE